MQPLRIVSVIDQQQSSLLLFENPLPQPITLNVVMTPPENLPGAFGLLNKKSKGIVVAPFKEVQVRNLATFSGHVLHIEAAASAPGQPGRLCPRVPHITSDCPRLPRDCVDGSITHRKSYCGFVVGLGRVPSADPIRSQVPFFFAPTKMREAVAYLSIESVQPKMLWKYPVIGIPEVLP